MKNYFSKDYPLAINDPALAGAERLDALRLYKPAGIGTNPKDVSCSLARAGTEVNNHIHTIYSFSPYTPSMAALIARDAGLGAAGSVDHDSIAAAEEMLSACAVLGIGSCVGFEVRVSFRKGADGKSSSFATRKLNNPDSAGCAYMTVQGIPRQSVPVAAKFLEPIREKRLERTKNMCIAANAMLLDSGFCEIDFDRDIYALSQYSAGGEITERHLLAAMAEKLVQKYGKGAELAEALKLKMGIGLTPRLHSMLCDRGNPHYLYDVLGVLKAECLPEIYIEPGEEECISAKELTDFARSISAIPAYAYLGDVGDSPTGDKLPEKFEDDYIEELFTELSRIGCLALAYMPPRNTLEQLRNLRRLSAEWSLMEISGVDINSSRQSFNCPEVLHDEFRHLIDTTWALIAHERLASVSARYGIFSADNPAASLGLPRRIAIYADLGKKLDLFHPDESAAALAEELAKGRFG